MKEKDSENKSSLKNLLTIIGSMAVIYFATIILWNIYEENLETHHYYPYVKIKESGYKRVKTFPFTENVSNITIEKTDYTNLYMVNTDFGSFTIQTFDDRFFFFQNSEMAIVSYPSYDFRGLEYAVIQNNGNFFKFVIVPNEKLVENIFIFVENINHVKILRVPDIENYNYIKEEEDRYSINIPNNNFFIPKNFIETIGESDGFLFFISKKYGLFNKIYYLEKDTQNFGELIMITESNFPNIF
ncbi:hypothetical protein [Petrotoga sp. 9PWA.NaAc.5.4]|uniref:hypothetical protein n=1 Tax=Petrotoga sp. 9PWA.NaAc.5.4 TaxID=1434328 RepID=UPI000CC3468D|nr:hypothetical protein [Petrotoga sp. 9PWA.NaAc.5.4]PNR95810.1 hypothetical protein X924_04195 [Petrotoga sp. 9PWA.NaAc.5.4]